MYVGSTYLQLVIDRRVGSAEPFWQTMGSVGSGKENQFGRTLPTSTMTDRSQ